MDLSTRSPLNKEELIDKIAGCIYGAALGDAVGLSTEFMTKVQAKHLYGVGPIQFGEAKGFKFWRDNHRSRFAENDFTDDTDQLLLILQSVLATEGKLIPTHFAFCLEEWSRVGFPELEKNPRGIGFTVGSVFSSPDFLENPHSSAYKVWNKCNRNLAANGAVMRTAGLGIPYFWDEVQVAKNALNAAKVTHADPRSVASAVIVSVIISRILRGQEGPATTALDEQFKSQMTNWLLQGTDYEEKSETLTLIQPNPKKIATLEPEPEPEPEKPESSGILSKISSVFSKTKPKPKVKEVNITYGLFPQPEHEPLDVKRGETPATLPNVIPPGIDTFGSDPVMEDLCQQVVQDYSFLVQSNPLCPESDSESNSWADELHAHCFPPEGMNSLHLGERESIGYTYKCLGSAIYCATRAIPSTSTDHVENSKDFFKRVITELTLEAGDSDTNCAVAGGLLGCRLGKSNLPKDWTNGLRNKEFLDTIIEQLCSLVLQ
jgi:ADP-ribosylglycohydrolase